MENAWMIATRENPNPRDPANIDKSEMLWPHMFGPSPEYANGALSDLRNWVFISDGELTEVYLFTAHGQQLASLRYDPMTPNAITEVWVDLEYRTFCPTDRFLRRVT